MEAAYLRFVEHEGVQQWVLFDEDGEWIASSPEKWRLQDMARRSGIKVVERH